MMSPSYLYHGKLSSFLGLTSMRVPSTMSLASRSDLSPFDL
jgi:hypothetical protein